MATPVHFTITQGEPVAVTSTVVGGAARWPNTRVVYGEIRRRPGDPLIFSLTPYLSTAVSGADVVVSLNMTGAQTRTLTAGGDYDVFVAEPATNEDTALRVLSGVITLERAVTRAP